MVKSENMIFVYDSSKGFARFMIKHFQNQYEVVVCFNQDCMLQHDLSSFKVAFFVINENDDIISFLPIRNSIKNVFVCSNNPKNNQILLFLNNIDLIDMQSPKNRLIDKIQHNLEVIFSNYKFNF